MAAKLAAKYVYTSAVFIYLFILFSLIHYSFIVFFITLVV